MIEEATVSCPSCGEPVAVDVDTTAGAEQAYYEDCPVCCRPMRVVVRCRPGRLLAVEVAAE